MTVLSLWRLKDAERRDRTHTSLAAHRILSSPLPIIRIDVFPFNSSRSVIWLCIPGGVGQRILDFLGVPYHRLVTTLIKTGPERKRRLDS